MKKLIVTTACTLALSVFGAFGGNLDFLNLNNNTAADSNIENTDQDTTDVEEEVNNSDKVNADAENGSQDTIKEDKDITSENKEDNIVKDTEKVTSDNADDTVEANNSTSQAAPAAAKESKQAPANSNTASKEKETAPEAKAQTNAASNYQAPAKANSNTAAADVKSGNYDTYSTNNGQVIVYKGVDLSNCRNTQDVVNKLQNSGYSNINIGNIRNYKSLEDILAAIQNNNGSANNNTQTEKPSYQKPATNNNQNNTGNTGSSNTGSKNNTGSTSNSGSASNTGINSYASQVLQLVNQERAKAGLSALTTNATLTAAANKRAQETVQSFSHTRPNGSSFSTALQEFGVPFNAAGENIAYGQRTPQEVVTAWMNSPGHRANILNAKFGKVGIGVYQGSNGTIYWSQLFTN